MNAPSQYFRAGVGAAIVNRSGLVLALERADMPGAWQLPQGGLQAAESPLHALFREVQEETGIPKSELELLDTYPEPLAYELPPEAWSKKTARPGRLLVPVSVPRLGDCDPSGEGRRILRLAMAAVYAVSDEGSGVPSTGVSTLV